MRIPVNGNLRGNLRGQKSPGSGLAFRIAGVKSRSESQGSGLAFILFSAETWANAKVIAMRDASSLKRDAAIGGKHNARFIQIQVFNQPAAHENRAQAAMK